MKIGLSLVMATLILAGCSVGTSHNQHATLSVPDVSLSVTTHAPSEQRWASLQTHMRKHGYMVEKYDPWCGNRISDLQNNPIGTTVLGFFPASLSEEEIKTASGRHGVIYHLNLPARVEMRSIHFPTDKLRQAHRAKLMAAFTEYTWRGFPQQSHRRRLSKTHHSVLANPLIAEPLYLTKHIERMGTGIRDMIRRCKAVDLPEPMLELDGGVWVTTIRRKTKKTDVVKLPRRMQGSLSGKDLQEVGGHDGVYDIALTETMKSILYALKEPTATRQLLDKLGYPRRTRNFTTAMNLLMKADLVNMTILEKPRSKNQKYCLTEAGRARVKAL